ncbi:hypothetical protein SDC9_185866 [bioreactor metagenome]|uniref:SHOCT domain-containing protein n=1 Tax=bioreactor metagenome TaxID=1076179 RepID=A0A645HIW0_9ZZZZ
MFVTQKQLIRLDRELLGISQDVKRFYYEDITSMSVQQNNGGLAGMLLNATLKLCNLVVYVAGTQLSIQTLSVPEAERVVSIYNAHKNALRNAAKQPIVVQSNTASQEDDPIAKLERLSKLKAAGVLSEEEFNAKKMELLSKI